MDIFVQYYFYQELLVFNGRNLTVSWACVISRLYPAWCEWLRVNVLLYKLILSWQK